MGRQPRVRPEKPMPNFLDAKNAASYLGLNVTGTIQNIRPFMSYLELPHDEDWTGQLLYPVPYLVPLRAVLRGIDKRGYIGPTEHFSRTQTAHNAIRDAELSLDAEINEAATDGNLSPRAIMKVLDVVPSTITRWNQNGYA